MKSAPGRFSNAIISENERGFVAVIPDIKCVSPKEGDLLQGRDPVGVAKYFVDHCGAPMLSVVTESSRFRGSVRLLSDIIENADAPVLRKDFITNDDQVAETADLGAAAVLLICAITDEKNLCRLYEHSIKAGLEPFVEVCAAKEMELAKKLGARLIGINNRNIVAFERDDGGPSRTASLASGVPSGALLVSESGILSHDDAKSAALAGASAILVGTALWKSSDMEETYKSLRVRINERD